jgi:Tol biopolymer transport system component
MKKHIFLIACLASFSLMSIGQRSGFDYFGLPFPGDSIKLFAPDIVSLKNVREKSIAISPDGNEVFFSGGKAWPESKVMHIKKINNKWTTPKVAEFSNDCFATEPAFSPDGKYLFYSSSKGESDIKNYCIWRIEKKGDSWGEAKKVINIEDPEIWEFHPSVTKDGTVYFCYWDSAKVSGKIYKSVFKNNTYSKPENVIIPFPVHGSDTDPFVDPDGKYIIISGSGQNGSNSYDVFISYKKTDGSFDAPVIFNKMFNTSGDEDSFDISPDGKYVFIYKQDDVYWTEADGVLINYQK